MKSDKKMKYIFDKKGKKTAIILPIYRYKKLLEDLEDLKSIRSRKNERTITLAEVKNRLRKKYG